jgi:HD-GYP domain-containing protein (c-di-GMP phosphodiesterase class II)
MTADGTRSVPATLVAEAGRFMSVAEINFDQGELMAIGLETLRASNVLPFDLYLPGDKRNRLVLYRERKHPFAEADLNRLRQRGVRTLYISQGDSSTYREYLRDTLLKNDDIPPIERYQVLREATRSVLTEALTKGDAEAAVKVTNDISEGLVTTVCESEFVLQDLMRVMSHDYSVFTHAINVTTNCLMLAKQLGINDRQELLQIGQGALIKDIGVQGVPRNIIEKPGKLTERERRLMQEHTIRGFKELCHRKELTWGQLMMVYSHHERCDGRGYPVGLLQSEIHEYARLCGICDVYEALCRERPYRRAARRRDALEYMDRQAGRAFDEEMMRCWMSIVAQEK